MGNTNLLGSYGGQAGDALMFRNVLINGCFRVWQRGTSQTSSGYGSDDRWVNLHNGSTKTHSQQAFTLGQTDVPGNPQFFSRTVVSSVAGAGNFVFKLQRIEDVRTFAGQTATLSFWAKADASKNMAIEFTQDFGTGGSPSSAVLGIGVTTIALTTSWKYYTVTVAVPSISGKTLGTDNNHNLGVSFWFDAGVPNFNSRTNSLGQQSGTFDIANAMLEAGPTATPFERRPYSVELALAQRYYYKVDTASGHAKNVSGFCIGGQNYAFIFVTPPVTMRSNAVLTHNLDNAQYTSGNPIGAQWTFIQDGNTYASKTGTAIFAQSQTGIGVYQSSWNVTARPLFGPGVILEYSAEL